MILFSYLPLPREKRKALTLAKTVVAKPHICPPLEGEEKTVLS
jgi:hypothetical protein